jgi:Domain of unknown function (DUF4219)
MTMQSGALGPQGVQLVFDGGNYDYWSIKMKTLLISQDLLEIMEEGFVEKNDEKGKDTVEASCEKKENKKKDAKVLYLIQQAIIDKKFPRIIGATSSKEAW